MKTLIIGGVAGGACAAARMRRLDEDAEIIVFERTGFVSYATCVLPYFVGNVIENEATLSVQTAMAFWQRFRVEVRLGTEVTAIDKEAKTVTATNLTTGESYTETYDKLIISTGAMPIKPPLSGIDLPKIHTVRTVEDATKLKAYIKATKPKKAVVIGGGFIGIEMAENFVHLDVDTTLVEAGNQVMAPIDGDMAAQVHNYMEKNGIKLRLNSMVSGFEQNGDEIQVQIKDGEPIPADVVILAIGVLPESTLAKGCGLELGIKGAIKTNEKMQTSDPDIYAIGDVVEVTNLITEKQTLLSMAGPASRQGRIAAQNICGIESTFSPTIGSSILKIFDLAVASTGINEKTAKAENMDYDVVINYHVNHAGSYPGATFMTIKTIYEKATGKILGAQIVGFEGVDKRIDVLATAIYAGLNAENLAELELAYAPPFSSAKDPVNMAGFTIENIRTGIVAQHHWHQVPALIADESAFLIDVRTEGEFATGHIPTAINTPLDDIRTLLDEIPHDKTIYVNCFSGIRSYIACRILEGYGYKTSNLAGGIRFYTEIATDTTSEPPIKLVP